MLKFYKRQMTIEEYNNSKNVHTIIINNARYQKNFIVAIENILNTFLFDNDIYFGFCRTDGMNLTYRQQRKLKHDIPHFFKNYGDIHILNEYLTIARIESNHYNHSFIPLIFDYYLDTVMFNPKVDWEIFRTYHYNYQEHRFEDIVVNGYSDILFYYHDSGDFGICFNSCVYGYNDVKNTVDLFFDIIVKDSE